MRGWLGLLLAVLAAPLSAQILPQPGADNPRIQSIEWIEGQEVILTTLPFSGLTVLLEPGEQIQRVTLDRNGSLDVRVSPELDSFLVLPRFEQVEVALLVESERRQYRFLVRTGTGLTAAYLVRFSFGGSLEEEIAIAPADRATPAATGQMGTYRLKGDRSVLPKTVNDDGARTYIHFGVDQALPAIFAIGPTGEEQVVNGHMRAGVFVIDRIYEELVFRIDGDKATARRRAEEGNRDG